MINSQHEILFEDIVPLTATFLDTFGQIYMLSDLFYVNRSAVKSWSVRGHWFLKHFSPHTANSFMKVCPGNRAAGSAARTQIEIPHIRQFESQFLKKQECLPREISTEYYVWKMETESNGNLWQNWEIYPTCAQIRDSKQHLLSQVKSSHSKQEWWFRSYSAWCPLVPMMASWLGENDSYCMCLSCINVTSLSFYDCQDEFMELL